jgi:hypothetical protein
MVRVLRPAHRGRKATIAHHDGGWLLLLPPVDDLPPGAVVLPTFEDAVAALDDWRQLLRRRRTLEDLTPFRAWHPTGWPALN